MKYYTFALELYFQQLLCNNMKYNLPFIHRKITYNPINLLGYPFSILHDQ